ncbi:MAG: sigma-70 family RNA polymerase sigma factor [Acidobacteria bacterium]|nr:sigma-70 family RNA polymerase sigma factor [Acidobacteriota bacterium]
MSTETRQTITRLLQEMRAADGSARERRLEVLVDVLYPELRRLAGRLMRRERAGHTLQPTALVNEAFLRLVGDAGIDWESRAHFLGVSARLMRQILVDHARRQQAKKRGGVAFQPLPIDEARDAAPADRLVDVLVLNDALERLAAVDLRSARVVELRIFGGLTAEEAASVLGVSKRTVDTDWSAARLWLAKQLGPASPPDPV